MHHLHLPVLAPSRVSDFPGEGEKSIISGNEVFEPIQSAISKGLEGLITYG